MELVTRQDVIAPGERTLEELAADINAGHAKVIEGLALTVRTAIAVGHDLLRAQEMPKSEPWNDWIAQNLPNISETATGRYMRLAYFESKLPPEITTGSATINEKGRVIYSSTIDNAIAYLNAIGARRPQSRHRPTVVPYEEVKRLKKEGLGNNQISDLLGCSVQTVKRASLPKGERSRREAAYRRRKLQREKDARRTALAREAAAHSAQLDEVYSLLRKCLDKAQAVHDRSVRGDYRRHVSAAMARLAEAEDHIGKALRAGQ